MQEETETAYLFVDLGTSSTSVRFEDSSNLKVIEIRILDDNLTDGTDSADTLYGTAAAEDLTGGLGNDTYHADAGDSVIELADGGTDSIFTAAARRLEANVENLTLTGSADVSGSGNALANRITGNLGDKRLAGGRGDDTLSGGSGNDTLLGGADNDRLAGEDGDDLMDGQAGGDVLLGGAGNDRLTGNLGHDTLRGDSGNDRLVGGDGQDSLLGGSGADLLIGDGGHDDLFGGRDRNEDTFLFRTFADSAVGRGRDAIHEFRSGIDRIDLSALDADSTLRGNQAFDFTGARPGAHAVWAIQRGEDLILRADHDGDGRADMEIAIVGSLRLDEADLIL